MKKFVYWLIWMFNISMPEENNNPGIVLPVELKRPLRKLDHNQKIRKLTLLMVGYHRGSLSRSQHDELDEWVGASEKNTELFSEMSDEDKVHSALKVMAS